MRPRAIQGVPGLNPNGSPSERFEQFARMIVRVPKAEADKEMGKSGLGKPLKRKLKKNGINKSNRKENSRQKNTEG